MTMTADAKLIASAILAAAFLIAAAHLMKRSDFESCVEATRAAYIKASQAVATSDRFDMGIARICSGTPA